MKKEVQFALGLKGNYKKDEQFNNVVYFAVDSDDIFLNGVSFGFGKDSKQRLKHLESLSKTEFFINDIPFNQDSSVYRINLDDSDIPLNNDSNVGGILSKSSNVSQAFALIDDSLSWRYFDECYLKDSRVNFALTGEKNKGTQGIEDSGTIEFSISDHTVYVHNQKFGSVDKNGNDIEETYISKKQLKTFIFSLSEILECTDTQKEKILSLLNSL